MRWNINKKKCFLPAWEINPLGTRFYHLQSGNNSYSSCLLVVMSMPSSNKCSVNCKIHNVGHCGHHTTAFVLPKKQTLRRDLCTVCCADLVAVGPVRMQKPGLSRERNWTMMQFQTVVAKASASHRGALNVLMLVWNEARGPDFVPLNQLVIQCGLSWGMG